MSKRRVLISVVLIVGGVGLCVISDFQRWIAIILFSLYVVFFPTSRPPSSGPTPTWPATENREGIGNSLESFSLDVDGNMGFISSHLGDEGVFRVLVKDADGDVVQVAADCQGECRQEAYVLLPAGNYTLEITAQERWYVIMGLP